VSDTDYIDQVFGTGGILARRFPGYQPRSGQLALVRAIDEVIRNRRHLLAEAPTGTGKSVAACVPAIYHAVQHGKRVVIVTANIALQEQLVRNDLPRLRELLPWPFQFAVLKGRAQFACQDRLVQIRGQQRDLFGAVAGDLELERVLDWAKTTTTGDISDLPFSPSRRTWMDVSVSAEGCHGDDCASHSACFAERARARAQEADVVVTNYHLLGAHLAARLETGQDCVLPPHDILILDEAHAAADILRECLGFRIVGRDLDDMVRIARELGRRDLAGAIEQVRLLDTLAAPARDGRKIVPLIPGADVLALDIVSALDTLARVTSQRAAGAEDDAKAAWQRFTRNATMLAARVTEATNAGDPNKVYWVELDEQGRPALVARPMEVAPLLRGALFGSTESVCLMSATLTTDGHFRFIRRELGVPSDAVEIAVESPFDFVRQSLLIVPDDLPDPRDPAFSEACARVFQDVIDRARGRTLGLFTSYLALNDVYEQLDRSRFRVLKQGDLPRTELIRLFKEDVHSVLLGTESFWTGIDVPGEALSAVVIAKLPFKPPDDPVLAALSERDGGGFGTQMLPRATIALKQGVGRLIRTQSDRGVVVICDRRLVDARYGAGILRSLPAMRRSSDLSDIHTILPEERHVAAV